jgi:hypothetical protein
LYALVHAFIRHQLCSYDQALADGADRAELRERISRAACRQYAWLRADHDPRGERDTAPEPEAERPYNSVSKRLNSLVSLRAQITTAVREVRKKRETGWREELAALEESLANATKEIDRLTHFFTVKDQPVEGGVLVSSVCSTQRVRGYDFAGRVLAECYTKSTGFHCPECGKTVMRTKVAIPVGAGKRQVAFSCICSGMLIEPAHASRMCLKYWREILASKTVKTNIVLADEHGIIYGHQLARDIAERRKDGKDAQLYRDVDVDAYCAFLRIHFGDLKCVQALSESDEITPAQLERISAEIVLSTKDAEMILRMQDV